MDFDDADPVALDYYYDTRKAIKAEIARRQNNLLSAIFNPDSED